VPVNTMLKKLKSHRSWMIDLALLGGILSLFYAFCLGSYPLFTPDEGRYSEVAREMVATGDYITPRVNGVIFLDKPILYYWLQATAINLFGLNEWALRFFPALIGVVGCLMSYICGRKLFNRRTGIVAAIILGATPLYFASAHYANLDLEVAVWISCTLLSFITAVRNPARPQTSWLFATYIFAALAFLTKGLIGFAFPVMIIGSWIVLTWRWNLLKKTHLGAGLMLAFVIVLPWYMLAQHENPDFLHYFFITQQFTRYLSAAEFNSHAPFWFYAPIVLIGFFPWTLFAVQSFYLSIKRVCKNTRLHHDELFLMLWFLIVFVFFSIPRSKPIGYILPVFPPLAMLTANYLVSSLSNIKPFHVRITAAIFATLSTLIAFTLLALPRYGWLNIDAGASPYVTTIAVIFLISAVISFLFIRSSFAALLSICCISTTTALLVLVFGASYLNTSTAKPLIMQVQSLAKPEDEIVNYFKFYYDTPLYLQKRVSVVADWTAPDITKKDNWRRELWNGMAYEKTDAWLLDEKSFWKKWRSKNRLFVFVNMNYFNQFESHTKNYYLLGKYNDIILLSNKPA
jgi:4-amino-4-deoxy-L-arabinose transferase-like glycosyltransferase